MNFLTDLVKVMKLKLWRHKMFIYFWWLDNFGVHEVENGSLRYKSQKFFKLMITRLEASQKLRFLLQQYYKTYDSWKVGPYLIMVDERENELSNWYR